LVGLAVLVCYQRQGAAECQNCLPLWLRSHHKSYTVWLAAMGVLL